MTSPDVHVPDVHVPDVQEGHRPGLAARAVLAVIGGYRSAISPLLAPSCRYVPTCSAYAGEAIDRFGLARGGWLAIRRLLRCHPWHDGGFDPVPFRTRGTGATTINGGTQLPNAMAPSDAGTSSSARSSQRRPSNGRHHFFDGQHHFFDGQHHFFDGRRRAPSAEELENA